MSFEEIAVEVTVKGGLLLLLVGYPIALIVLCRVQGWGKYMHDRVASFAFSAACILLAMAAMASSELVMSFKAQMAVAAAFAAAAMLTLYWAFEPESHYQRVVETEEKDGT